ncbi:MAG: sugar phosphate isomerase/epimerase, partial [Oscillospiraceae bacterium]|nr:sugar phosphate isomerase/epimerase [Oscillospiraceae bacterium]
MGMDLTLGINLGFAVNRYIEPEAWARIVGEDLGLRSVQLVADLINPFWPKGYLDDQVGRIKRSTEEYGISVDSVFTCSYTRVNHLLNPDAEARRFWLAWFKEFLEIGARLGAKTGGSHFGIMTFGTYDDPAKRQAVLEEGVKGWRELVAHATRLGYESVIFEPMSVPREMANTIEDTLAILDMVNGGGGVPFGVCLDVGHAPHPDQRDPYPWIERLGAVSPVIHLQQTELNKSH